MQSRIGCICLAFPHCVFSNMSSNCLPERIHSHTGCICLAFLHCVFSNESSKRLPFSMHNHTGCIYLSFLHCAFSNVSSNHLPERMQMIQNKGWPMYRWQVFYDPLMVESWLLPWTKDKNQIMIELDSTPLLRSLFKSMTHYSSLPNAYAMLTWDWQQILIEENVFVKKYMYIWGVFVILVFH